MSYKQETILVEMEDMIVGQLDPAEMNFMAKKESYTEKQNIIKRKPKKMEKAKQDYSEVEDWTIRSLDLLSPFDTDFISDHLRTRTKSEIEYRLNDPRFRQGAAEFKKIPIFIFELIFMRDRVVAHKCLMLLTSKQIIPLPCRRSQCDHEFTIPRAKLSFSSKSPYGFDVKDLCDFVSSNVRKEHFPYLRRNIYSMEDFLSAANVDYRNMMPSGENQPAKVVVTKDNLKKWTNSVVKIDSSGRVILSPEHQETLRNIVKAIGKNKWEDATQLLLAVYDSEIDFDAEDVEIYKRVAGYFRLNLDLDQRLGPMSESEDIQALYLYRAWHNTMAGPGLWSHIARHIRSRTAPQIQNRLSRVTESSGDITLDNVNRYKEDLSNPASFHYHSAHSISLTIFPKESSGVMDVTTKLQHEVRFVVSGTPAELFMMACKYTAIRCTHMGMEQNKFTYDPEKPAEQFIQYLKLTFTNSLKKVKLVDEDFHFNRISYNGPNIHQIMKTAETERFILPKDDFMRLNRRQVAASMSSPGPVRPPAPGVRPPAPGVRPPAPGVRPPAPSAGTPRGRGRGRGRGRPPLPPSTGQRGVKRNIE